MAFGQVVKDMLSMTLTPSPPQSRVPSPAPGFGYFTGHKTMGISQYPKKPFGANVLAKVVRRLLVKKFLQEIVIMAGSLSSYL